MMEFANTCKQISKKYNYDLDLVLSICKYQFYFISEVIKDDTDTHDILLHNLMKFKLKSRYKQNKQLKYTSK